MSNSKLEKVIEEFLDYITENTKTLNKHLETAESLHCLWECQITKQRVTDLFLIRFRFEQLLSNAGYNCLCKLKAFQNAKVKPKKSSNS